MLNLICKVELSRGEAIIENIIGNKKLPNFVEVLVRNEAIFSYGHVENNKVICNDKTLNGNSEIFLYSNKL